MQVVMRDDCDPTTFNAAIGPGTCVKQGGTTFSEFIDQLLSQGRAPAWHFAPEQLKLAGGGTLEAYNKGGEDVHEKVSYLLELPGRSIQRPQDLHSLLERQADDLGGEEQRSPKFLSERLVHHRREVAHDAIIERDTIQHHLAAPFCTGYSGCSVLRIRRRSA